MFNLRLQKTSCFFRNLLLFFFLFFTINTSQAGIFSWIKSWGNSEKKSNYIIVAPCTAGTGCIEGNAFEDYNSNGVDDTPEPGIQGIQVEIYNDQNLLVGTASSDNNGDWQVCGLTDGITYRVEFIIPNSMSSWATPTHVGSDNGSDVQFVTAPSCANFSLSSSSDFCEDDPELMVACFVNGPYNHSALAGEVAIARLTYSKSGDVDGNINGTTAEGNDPFSDPLQYTPAKPTPSSVAAYSEVGTVWGMVKSETKNKLYSSSYIKSGSSLGPGESTGAIFVTDDPEGIPSTSTYVDLNVIFGANTAGVNPHPVATTDFYWPNDTLTNPVIGKVGLGDMDITIDESLIYVVNLADRMLYQIPTTGALNNSTIQRFAIPTIGLPTVTDASGTPGTCPPADVRPFATGVDKEGNVYVGGVCSCESISAGMDAQPNNASYQLTAYVWKFDGTNFTLVLDESLRFNRDPSWNNTTYNTFDTHIEAGGTYHRDWEPWSDLTVAYGTQPDQNEPMLSDIEFDVDGNMLLGFRDRSGDIQAIYGGFTSSGDIYKACSSGTGTWQFENNGSCGGTTTGGANNDQGPTGGEFFFEDIQGDGISNSGNGGLLMIAGKGEVVNSVTDAVYLDHNGNSIFAPNAGGIQIFDNTTGEIVGAYNFYEADNDYSVVKASGIGDVEACCTPAPIEIGNYIWYDANQNGIQDVNEIGVNGMIVQLYDGTGAIVAQDTTVNGYYYFNQFNVDTTGISVNGSGVATPNTAWSGLDYATQYFIVYGDGQFVSGEFTIGGNNFTGTTLADVNSNGNDNIDSDVDGNNLTTGSLGARPDGLPFIDMTTTSTGSGNHTYDLGLALCEVVVMASQTGCTDNGNGTFTANYDVEVSWIGIPSGEDINVSVNGANAQTIVAGSTSPQTLSFAIGADGTGQDSIAAVLTTTTMCGDTIAIKSPVPCPTSLGSAPGDICNSIGSTEISGTVFEDWNYDGVMNQSEIIGVQGIMVTATDDAGTIFTTYTDAQGNYQFTGLTVGANYRIEFTLLETVGCWAQPTQNGANNGTTIQFVTSGSCANLGVASPNDYCEEEPVVVTSCFLNGDPLGGGTAAGEAAIVSLDYSGTNKTVIATTDEVGSVWGAARRKDENNIYTSAVLKRHVGFAALGEGGIYRTDLQTNTTTNFLDVESIGIDVGVNPRNASDPANSLPADKDASSQDSLAFYLIGKFGIGDIDFSDDGNTLWMTNLYDRKIYSIDLSNGTPTSNDVYSCSIPDACGGTGDAIPWGIKFHKGNVFVGVVCNAVNSKNRSDLQATVYKLSPDICSTSEVVSFPLDYIKGRAAGYHTLSDRWYPWITTWEELPPADDGSQVRPALRIHPQPILTDIEFDEDGDMILGFLDRTGLQLGYSNMNVYGSMFNGQDNGGFATMVGGDLIRVSMDNACNGTVENNGSAGATTTSGANNGQGIGGGEYYTGDSYGPHQETSLGGVAVLKGSDELVLSAYDPLGWDQGGLEWVDNTTGQSNLGVMLYTTTPGTGTFAKGVGIGDVEIICENAPIEIGNYVWKDLDGDGIQDPSEEGIAGIAMVLVDASGTLLDTSITDVNGNYYFNDSTLAVAMGISNTDTTGLIIPNTTYYVVAGFDQFNITDSILLGNYFLTDNQNAGSNDLIDSDANISDGTQAGGVFNGMPFIEVMTGSSGTVDHSRDFGMIPTSTIGNRVWLDENGDGAQDAGEPGIPNVVVELLDNNSNVIATTITDADGGYIFDEVPVGTYTVQVASGVPTGLNPIYDEDNGTSSPDMSTSVVLTEEEYLAVDFGYNWTPASDTDTPTMAATGALGDRVWNDADGDGIQDLGEMGIENITVNLYSDPDGDGVYNTLVTTTTTDANGNYIFDGLTPDGYVVEVLQSDLNSAGYTNPATGDPDGDTDNISEPIIIAPGDVYVNADFGYKNATNLADIGDYVFVDVNADNTFTLGADIGMAGVSVALIVDINGNGDWDVGEEVAATTLTDFDGSYLFPDAPAGDYVVVVTDTDNILVGLENSVDPDGGNDNHSGLTLVATDNLTQDFGYVPSGHASGDGFVGDYIFLDADGSDSYTFGEIGIEGVEVQLLDGVTDAVLATTITNKLGFYFFGNLPADDYKVKVTTTTLPNGLTNSVDAEGANGDNITNSFALAAGAFTLTKDFGYKATTPRTISGTIWEDENADGTFDGTETDRFQGVSVVLKNSDDEIIGITATAADGTYSFEGIPDGETYTVDVKEVHNYLEGYWHTTGTDSEPDYTTVTLSGADATDVDFGYYKEGASLGNRVWVDTDRDGIQDTGELGVRSVIVMLEIDYDNDNTPEITVSTTTGVDGYYHFDNLLLDEDYNGDGIGAEPNYTIKMTAPAGYASTNSDVNANGNDKEDADDMAGVSATAVQGRTDVTIQVDPNTEATEASYDFGLVEAGTIGNRVWVDENTDGIQDAGEPGIAGVIVELVDGSNNVIATVITDANGGYLFRNVAPGTYTVRVASGIPTALDNPIYDEDNGTSSPDEETSVTIGSGGEYLTADFGYNYVTQADTDSPSSMSAKGALGNRVWNDANGDGVQDAGEAGIPNITVNLYSDPENDGTFTNLVGTTTTDAFGNYIFDNLAPDGYVVEVVSAGIGAAGFVITPTGDPDGDSDNISETVIIAPGDVWLGGDFGYNSSGDPADIGSTVFVDVDADGIYNAANDIPLAGVTVALIDDVNGNGIWDTGEGVVATTETSADGTYLFPDLPAGDYVIQVTDSDNVIDNLSNNADPDGGSNNYSGVSLGATDKLTENFGYVPTGHTSTTSFVGDLIFLDANGNGIYDAGDTGIEGVQVQLLDGNTNAVLENTTTNENGLYFFGNLEADDYKVKVNTVTVPSGLTNSIDPDGSAPGDNETNSFALPAGTGDMTKDFGYKATTPHDITGTIWNDTDAEGVLDGTETGRFENVTIELQDANGNIVATTTTDASGNYTFAGVPDGTYTVEVTDVNEVLENQWHSLGTDSENDPVSITVSGSNVTDLDFGYYTQPAALGNYVWDDVDGNGIQDSGESGLSGVVVTLEIDYNNDGTADVTVATLTDATGYFDFDNLLLDEDYNGDGSGTEPTYTISATAPTGYMNTLIDANSNGNDKEDADDPAGVVAGATQGEGDVSKQTDPNTETTPATFDFGFRSILLPVKLVEFRAETKGCNVELLWVTESEEDFDRFELEWSGNGQDYRTLEMIKAKGGNFTQVYSYKDRQASSFNYYRLKMVDLDGTFDYSKVIQASTDCPDTHELTIYPNPVSPGNGILNVKFYSKRPEAQLQITDMLGRVVKRLTLDVDAEFLNTVQMDISDLPSGNYTMQILGDRTSKIFTIQE